MNAGTRAGPIIHVVQHLTPGGLEVMALELMRVQARAHETMIISLEGDRDQTLAAWPRLQSQQNQIAFTGKRPGLDPACAFRLRALFSRLRPLCVHTHHVGPLLYAGPAARAAGVASRIHTEHDAWHLQNARRRRIVRLALAAARPIVVADAPQVADAVARAFGGQPPLVILNGVDTTRFSPGGQSDARAALSLPSSGRIVGIVARLERIKGVDLAIAALPFLPDTLLAIAGSGSQRDALKAQAAALGVESRVRFIGHIDDTAPFYRAIDILCLPSRAEGLPLAPLEAQACGTRVVAARVGGVPTAIDPESGFLVEPENPEALAQALRCCLCEIANSESAAPDHRSRVFVERTASLATMEAAYTSLIGETLL